MKVLLLATYPIVEPRHGGQLRTRNIYEEYKKSGIDVRYIGVFPLGAYPSHAKTDFQFSGDVGGRVLPTSEQAMYDFIWGMHVADTAVAQSALLEELRRERYDYIQIDLLYVWPLVRRCLGLLDPAEQRPQIIYSSQNNEHEMKRQVLLQMGATAAAAERYGNEVLALERDVAQKAKFVFAVSEADCDHVNDIGKRNDCVLAKNGTAFSKVPLIATEDWRSVLPTDPFAVFISSAHLPNAVGFSSILGESLAFLPPDRKLVIAGGVTGVIERSAPYRKWMAINNARTLRLGEVDDVGIAALRRFAHVFVLPITAGGGSNIKTAEALLTGAYVLGTPTAFRGYEEYIGEPGVHVEADPAHFRAKLVQLLHRERIHLSEGSMTARSRLLWESTLASMPAQLADQ